jgi:hypothetical protein
MVAAVAAAAGVAGVAMVLTDAAAALCAGFVSTALDNAPGMFRCLVYSVARTSRTWK